MFWTHRRGDVFKTLANGPAGDDSPAFEELWREARSAAHGERFLHWEAVFPGVWSGWQTTRPSGGFDAVIGNPPWDRIKLQEVEWFATRDSELALAPTAAERKAGIRRLRSQGAPLAVEFDEAKARADRFSSMFRKSRDYPLLGVGDINLYSLFVERAMSLVKPDGFIGLLTPSGIYADKTAARFFKSVSTSGRLGALLDFENRRLGTGLPPYFPAVDSRFKFCALIFGGEERRFEEGRVRVLPARHGDGCRHGPPLSDGARGLRASKPEHWHCSDIPDEAGRRYHAVDLRATPGAMWTDRVSRSGGRGGCATGPCST